MYLLPVYFLVLFSCLRVLISHRAFFYFVSMVVLGVMLFFSIQNCFSWGNENLLRQMLLLAGHRTERSLVIIPRSIDGWPATYYATKYGQGNKILFFYRHDEQRKILGIIQDFCHVPEFTVIQPFKEDFLSQKIEKLCGKGSVSMVGKKEQWINVGPYFLLKGWARVDLRYVVELDYKMDLKVR